MESRKDTRLTWVQCRSRQVGRSYFYNTITSELQWRLPESCTTINTISSGESEFMVGRCSEEYRKTIKNKPTLHVKEGELVLVLHSYEDKGWAYAQNVKGISGFIPLTLLEEAMPKGLPPVPETPSTFCTFSSSSSSSSLLPTSPAKARSLNVDISSPAMPTPRRSHFSSSGAMTTGSFSRSGLSTSDRHTDLPTSSSRMFDFESGLDESHSSLIPTCDLYSDINEYDVNDYCAMYCRRSGNPLRGRDPKKLSYTGSRLHSSLSTLSDTENTLAMEMSEKILQFTGDTRKSELKQSEAVRDSIKDTSQSSHNLIDELYLQLIRHTTANPSEESCVLGWELLCYFCSLYHIQRASPLLYPYLLNYCVRSTGYDQRKRPTPPFSEKGLQIVRSLAFYCVKCISISGATSPLTNRDLNAAKEYGIPLGAFGCSLSDLNHLEGMSSLFYNNGLLGMMDPLYDSTLHVERNRVMDGVYFGPDALLNFICSGAYMLVRSSDRKQKQKHISLSSSFEELVIESVSTKSERMLNLSDYNITLDPHQRPEEEDSLTSFYLEHVEDPADVVVITAYNVPERNRWVYALRCVRKWLNGESEPATHSSSALGLNLKRLSFETSNLRSSLMSHLATIIKHPNNYSAHMIAGCDVNLKVSDSPDPVLGKLYFADNLGSLIFEGLPDLQFFISFDSIQSIELARSEDLSEMPYSMQKNSLWGAFFIRRLPNTESNQDFTSWSYILYCYDNWIQAIKGGELLVDISDPRTDSKAIRRAFNNYANAFYCEEASSKHPVPRLLLKLLRRLRKLPTQKTEGVFRLSAEKSKLESLCSHLNQGYYEAMDIEDDPLVIAAAILKWLREMPQKLIPDEYTTECEEIGRLADGDPTPILQEFPEINRNALLLLCRFFKDLSRFEKYTMMTVANFATVLAPDIFNLESFAGRPDLSATFVHSYIRFTEKLIRSVDYPDPELCFKP